MSLLQEIKELRNQLDKKEREYTQITPPCDNIMCSFHNEDGHSNCRWSVLLEDCKDYIPKE